MIWNVFENGLPLFERAKTTGFADSRALTWTASSYTYENINLHFLYA